MVWIKTSKNRSVVMGRRRSDHERVLKSEGWGGAGLTPHQLSKTKYLEKKADNRTGHIRHKEIMGVYSVHDPILPGSTLPYKEKNPVSDAKRLRKRENMLKRIKQDSKKYF